MLSKCANQKTNDFREKKQQHKSEINAKIILKI